MIATALALLLQAQPNYFDRFDPPAEKLGSGPHILVISDGAQMTRIDYKSGPSCMKARDEVRRQNAPGPVIRGEGGGILIPPPSRVKAFCVPR